MGAYDTQDEAKFLRCLPVCPVHYVVDMWELVGFQ